MVSKTTRGIFILLLLSARTKRWFLQLIEGGLRQQQELLPETFSFYERCDTLFLWGFNGTISKAHYFYTTQFWKVYIYERCVTHIVWPLNRRNMVHRQHFVCPNLIFCILCASYMKHTHNSMIYFAATLNNRYPSLSLPELFFETVASNTALQRGWVTHSQIVLCHFAIFQQKLLELHALTKINSHFISYFVKAAGGTQNVKRALVCIFVFRFCCLQKLCGKCCLNTWTIFGFNAKN